MNRNLLSEQHSNYEGDFQDDHDDDTGEEAPAEVNSLNLFDEMLMALGPEKRPAKKLRPVLLASLICY